MRHLKRRGPTIKQRTVGGSDHVDLLDASLSCSVYRKSGIHKGPIKQPAVDPAHAQWRSRSRAWIQRVADVLDARIDYLNTRFIQTERVHVVT